MNDKNNKKDRQLTIYEKWDIDDEIIKKAGGLLISSPQCKVCKYLIKGNAENCEKYKIPNKKPDFVSFIEKECPEFVHNEILQIEAKTQEEKQLLGSILGFCVGDALGVPLEFSSREDRKKDPVQEMRAYGTSHQYFGTWSDDTSMTLCLMESLIDGYNVHDIADKFCKFYYDNYWTPYNKVFDIGNTTALAINRMKDGINPVGCGGSTERDNGNGSLMRILPLAFYLKNMDDEDKIRITEEVSSLTHSHKRSKLACIFYVELVTNLIKGFSKEDSYKNAINYIYANCNESYKKEINYYDRILNGNIHRLSEDEIRSTGYVVYTLEAVMWCFLNTNNYKDSIFKAINLGGDTDTIAAITGGLSGIYYGLNKIPSNWIQCLARKKEIYNLCIKFADSLEA